MDCKTCKEQRTKKSNRYDIDVVSMMALETNKRLVVVIVMLIVLVAGCIASIFVLNKARTNAVNELRELERSIETAYEYNVEQEADNNGNNYFAGGDFNG